MRWVATRKDPPPPNPRTRILHPSIPSIHPTIQQHHPLHCGPHPRGRVMESPRSYSKGLTRAVIVDVSRRARVEPRILGQGTPARTNSSTGGLCRPWTCLQLSFLWPIHSAYAVARTGAYVSVMALHAACLSPFESYLEEGNIARTGQLFLIFLLDPPHHHHHHPFIPLYPFSSPHPPSTPLITPLLHHHSLHPNTHTAHLLYA